MNVGKESPELTLLIYCTYVCRIWRERKREINYRTYFPFWRQKSSPKEEAHKEMDSPDEEPDKARFTLQELRDVLQEKNELKAQVFMLQEELAYYQR